MTDDVDAGPEQVVDRDGNIYEEGDTAEIGAEVREEIQERKTVLIREIHPPEEVVGKQVGIVDAEAEYPERERVTRVFAYNFPEYVNGDRLL